MRKLIYVFRYRLHIWLNVPGMSLRYAANYPTKAHEEDWKDPIKDAESEMSYMGEG